MVEMVCNFSDLLLVTAQDSIKISFENDKGELN